MKIHGLNKLTLLDYPGLMACTVFTGNCNLRCPFCQNAPLVLFPEREPVIPEEELAGFLKKRSEILEGVCVTGGEPTLSPALPEFLSGLKSLGYAVKLDTNGTNPELLKSLLRITGKALPGAEDTSDQCAGILKCLQIIGARAGQPGSNIAENDLIVQLSYNRCAEFKGKAAVLQLLAPHFKTAALRGV